MKASILFPNRFKRIGWILLVPSLIAGVLILFFKTDFNIPDSRVFTLYSTGFLSSPKVMSCIDGNYTNTIVGILFIMGALLVAFSKEKQEDEFIARTRLESLVWATYVNYAILILCFLFFFNLEFMMVMILNMFTILIFFIIRFYYILYKTNKSLGHEK
ncbi:MAG: hypothetical protein NTU44_03430 [Bacteroidetes bacterium]|nr:hypothetical protein [Bacteroidota bacterium]